MTEPTLFPVDQTTDAQCPVCGAVRPAGEPKTPSCQWEHEREGRRPAACLNSHDPRHADLPF